MFKYLTTKNIENHKYNIAEMLNSSNISSHDLCVVKKCDNFIQYSKLATRIYFFSEVSSLIYNFISKKNNILYKSTMMIIRVNALWLLSNIITNLYLDKYMPINKPKSNKFNKYIINKY
jgi:hypothetical protein